MGGRLHLYQRENSRFWQCAIYLGGRNHRNTTKTESLAQAKDIAEDWYLELKGKARAGELRHGKTFKFAAEKFQIEYEAITAGEAKPRYVKGHGDRLRVHLLPFFGHKVVSEITPGLVQEYRVHRATSCKHPKTGEQPPPYLYLPPIDGGGRHLSNRQKLPYQRRNDRKFLRRAHQEHDQCGGGQCAKGGERRPQRAVGRPPSEARSEREAPENPRK